VRQALDITGLLVAVSNGDETARTGLIEAVYDELRRLARGYLRRERRDHTLPPTGLVHEVYREMHGRTT
jgi:RNA polymerase sigma-70 factor, ECF subfamily